MADTRGLSFGEKAVGITFNPGGNEKVNRIKQEVANMIDFLHYEREEILKLNPTPDLREQVRMLSVAITELQTGQMWAVKAITWNL